MGTIQSEWLNEYVGCVRRCFGERVLFVGLQGSHGRGEAGKDSDIDLVLILDHASADDLRAYDAAISALPQREKICGFISGRDELRCWSKADLFQFYHDTTPLLGELAPLLPTISAEDVRQAILFGACTIYHLCGHNIVHEKSPDILQGLYKSAVFVMQAVHFQRTGRYLKAHRELLLALTVDERTLLAAYLHDKSAGKAAGVFSANFTTLSSSLFAWSGRIIREYGSCADVDGARCTRSGGATATSKARWAGKLKLFVAIVCTALITALGCTFVCSTRPAIAELWLLSSVKAPGRMALQEIMTELKQGNVADAENKLAILQAEWQRFESENDFTGEGIGNIMLKFLPPPADTNSNGKDHNTDGHPTDDHTPAPR